MAPGQIEKKGALGREFTQVRFGRLYREQGRAVLAYALRRVEDPEDAADVVAETFLVAWRRLDEVPIGARERLWLYAVARRVTANLRRAEGRRSRLAERLAESLRSELVTNPAPGGEAAEVLRAMGDLEEEDRELLLLVSWEELSRVRRQRSSESPRSRRAVACTAPGVGCGPCWSNANRREVEARNSTWRKQDEDA